MGLVLQVRPLHILSQSKLQTLSPSTNPAAVNSAMYTKGLEMCWRAGRHLCGAVIKRYEYVTHVTSYAMNRLACGEHINEKS